MNSSIPDTPETDDRPKAFDDNLVGYQSFLWKMSRKFRDQSPDREDLVQETICTALSRWSSSVAYPKFTSWLVYVMRSVVSDERRKAMSQKRNGRTVDIDDVGIHIPQEASQEAATDVQIAIDSLPDKRGSAFLLMSSVGYDLAEIGEVAGISKQGVHSVIARTRRDLKKRIGAFKD